MELIETGLRQGVWEGLLVGAPRSDSGPDVVALHQDREVEGVELTPVDDGRWRVRVPVPSDAVTDGVQTVLLMDKTDDAKLAHFTIIAGAPASDDMRAEIELLRAELDLLKRAFRRHCLETT